jgi:hypothetical protein
VKKHFKCAIFKSGEMWRLVGKSPAHLEKPSPGGVDFCGRRARQLGDVRVDMVAG